MASEKKATRRFDYSKPHALVTFAYAKPPTRSGDRPDYYTRLCDAAEAAGWHFAAANLIDPARDNVPPLNGKDYIEGLDALIARAQEMREGAMSYAELDTDLAPYPGDLESMARAVYESFSRLPDPE